MMKGSKVEPLAAGIEFKFYLQSQMVAQSANKNHKSRLRTGVDCLQQEYQELKNIVCVKIFSTTPHCQGRSGPAHLLRTYAPPRSIPFFHQPCGASTKSSTSLVSVSALCRGSPPLGVIGCCSRMFFI